MYKEIHLMGVVAMKLDGVFSGGGIKGIALIGAYEEIENRGHRFDRVAGASAGAIIAALIAAQYSSKEIYQILDELSLKSLLDERKTILPFAVTKWILLYWRLGLYKGNALEEWLAEILARKGLKTFADLPPQHLRVVASDLTNGRMIVLPDDLIQYGIEPRSFSIAKAVRMSCSIPYFFEPCRLRGNHECNIIVDGGVLSNFPMWLFDRENIKKVRPVLGIQLSNQLKDIPKNKIDNAIQLFGALFETMKDAHDARYISRRDAKNIIFIPSNGFSPIEFDLSDEKKQELMQQGRENAREFFSKWSY